VSRLGDSTIGFTKDAVEYETIHLVKTIIYISIIFWAADPKKMVAVSHNIYICNIMIPYIYIHTEKIPKCHYEHFIAIIFQDVSRRKRAFHHFYQPFFCRPYPPFWGDLHRRCVTDLKFASGCCWGRKMVACHRLKLWFKNQHGDQNLVS
jgi:hypothetical protein